MTKAVLFDLTQTLVDSADGFRAAEKQAQARVFQDLNTASWDDFLSRYRKLRKQFQETAQNYSRPDLWQQVYRDYQREGDTRLLEGWELDYWARVRAETVLFPETAAVLEKLAGRFLLALVTNKQGPAGRQNHSLSPFPELEKLFKVTVVAGQTHIPAKPDPAPFLLCLERLGVPAADAVYVGDDWRIDVCGARAAGIQPIWLKHHTVRRKWPDVETSVPVIERLDQLLEPDGILARGRTST